PAPTAAPTAAPTPAPPTRTAAAPAATQAAPPTAWTTEVQDTEASSSGSSNSGSTRVGRWFSRTTGGSESAAPVAPAAAPTTATASGGLYRLQLANSRSEAEAKALWQQAAKQTQQLASARPQIEKIDIGNFGTFYSLKVGPYADKAQSQSLCNSLKRGGIDCSVVTPDGP
ncbi:MAG: SPOR domain-containing protein, partial [Methyloceanibacter sp.]